MTLRKIQNHSSSPKMRSVCPHREELNHEPVVSVGSLTTFSWTGRDVPTSLLPRSGTGSQTPQNGLHRCPLENRIGLTSEPGVF